MTSLNVIIIIPYIATLMCCKYVCVTLKLGSQSDIAVRVVSIYIINIWNERNGMIIRNLTYLVNCVLNIWNHMVYRKLK